MNTQEVLTQLVANTNELIKLSKDYVSQIAEISEKSKTDFSNFSSEAISQINSIVINTKLDADEKMKAINELVTIQINNLNEKYANLDEQVRLAISNSGINIDEKIEQINTISNANLAALDEKYASLDEQVRLAISSSGINIDEKIEQINTISKANLTALNEKYTEIQTKISEIVLSSDLGLNEKIEQIKAAANLVLQNLNSDIANIKVEIAQIIANAKNEIANSLQGQAFTYMQEANPAINTNPTIQNAIWFNTSTGECFVCIDNTLDANVWRGSFGTIISTNQQATAPVVDDFPKKISSKSKFNYTPKGALDADGSVMQYEVYDISPTEISVTNKVINANESFEFSVTAIETELDASIKIRAIDDKGLPGKEALVRFKLMPNFAGDMGELGAGVGVNHAAATKCGLTPMLGCDDPSSDNFGNYTDANNSIFVCIPRIYYQINNNVTVPELAPRKQVLISYEEKPNYILAPAFEKSDGTSVECVFVSKYQLSNSKGCDVLGGIAASYKNADPVSSQTYNSTNAYNSFSRLTGRAGVNPSDLNKGAFSVVKTMGDKYCLHYALLHQVYYLIAEAHLQACIKKYGSLAAIPASVCAWSDKEPFYPKGNNSNSLSDYDDTSLTFSKAAYSNKALTGSCSNLAKTSHNGQNCGIIDLNGNMWEINAGFIRITSGFYVAKGIDKLVELTESNYEDTSRYKLVSFIGRDDDANRYIGNGSNALFSADENNKYADATLRTLNTARSSAGLNAFGKDYQYLLTTGSAPRFGGDWSSGSGAGLLTVYYYGWASCSTNCGLRALLVP